MKKTKVILSAAVAGLFAVSAYAGKKADLTEVPGKTEEQCKTHKDAKWKDGKCWTTTAHAGCGAACGGKDASKSSTTTTTETGAATTTTPATK